MLNMLIHGDAKVGKTWLACSAPKPILYFDSEAGGMRFVPEKQALWKDLPKGEYADLTVVKTTSFEDVQTHLKRAQAEKWPFKSVVIDSLSELFFRETSAEQSRRGGDMQYKGWEYMLRNTLQMCGQLRDLSASGEIVCLFVCASEKKDDNKSKAVPMLQGKTQTRLPYMVDAVGHLTVNLKGGRELLLAPRPWALAGSRLGGLLPDVIHNPNISEMAKALTTNNTERAQQ